MSVTHVERSLLGRLAAVGGRYTFRPDGTDQIAYGVFDREIVRMLQSLQAKGLVRIDDAESRLITMPGNAGKYAAIVAELTDAGRAAIQ